MEIKRNLKRYVPETFDTTKLLYPRDRFDLVKVDHVDEWDYPRKYKTKNGTVSFVARMSSVTVTLRCKRCGTVKTVIDKPNVGCKEGPCNVAWKDWTGHRFGHLVALEYVPLENTRKSKWHRKAKWYWKCQCDCGRIYYKDTHDLLVSGHTECGFCAREHVTEKNTLAGRGAAWHRAYRVCKRNAVSRGYDITITFEEFKEICEKPCYYCGASPKERSDKLIKNGVDRFDNSKGYTPENCVPCCPVCNTVKLDYDYDFLMRHLGRMLETHKKRSTTIPEGSTPKQVETDSSESNQDDTSPDLGF